MEDELESALLEIALRTYNDQCGLISRARWQSCAFGHPIGCGHPCRHLLVHLPEAVAESCKNEFALKYGKGKRWDDLSDTKKAECSGKYLCLANAPYCLECLEPGLLTEGLVRRDGKEAPTCFCLLCRANDEHERRKVAEESKKKEEARAIKEANASKRQREKDERDAEKQARRATTEHQRKEKAQSEAARKAATASKGKEIGGSSAAQMASASQQRVVFDVDDEDDDEDDNRMFGVDDLAAGASSLRTAPSKRKSIANNQMATMQRAWDTASGLAQLHQLQNSTASANLSASANRAQTATFMAPGAQQGAIVSRIEALRQSLPRLKCTCRAPFGCYQGASEDHVYQMITSNVFQPDLGRATMTAINESACPKIQAWRAIAQCRMLLVTSMPGAVPFVGQSAFTGMDPVMSGPGRAAKAEAARASEPPASFTHPRCHAANGLLLSAMMGNSALPPINPGQTFPTCTNPLAARPGLGQPKVKVATRPAGLSTHAASLEGGLRGLVDSGHGCHQTPQTYQARQAAHNLFTPQRPISLMSDQEMSAQPTAAAEHKPTTLCGACTMEVPPYTKALSHCTACNTIFHDQCITTLGGVPETKTCCNWACPLCSVVDVAHPTSTVPDSRPDSSAAEPISVESSDSQGSSSGSQGRDQFQVSCTCSA